MIVVVLLSLTHLTGTKYAALQIDFETCPCTGLQAGHFGQAPFDPLQQTTDYNRQAEVTFYVCFHP